MRSWIEKQRNILDFTLSSLLRRRWKNFSLLLVYLLVVFGLASVMFFTQALKREARVILRGTPEIIVQRLVAGRHDLIPVSYAARISQIRGVEAVRERLWGYYFDPVAQANFTLMVPEDTAAPVWEQYVAVGEGVARLRELSRGSTLSLRAHDGNYLNFKVRGIFSRDSGLVTSDLILISDANFRHLFAIPEAWATDLTVRVRNQKEIPTVAAKIVQALPDTRAILRDEILRTYDAVFDWRGGIVLVILAGAVLAFLVFAWDKATGLSAEERREIGILKAIGWETGDVLQMKFWEGLTVSLTAFFLGVLLAYAHIFFTGAAFFAPVLKGWSTLYPDFRLTPGLDAYQLAVLFFFTVMPYTVVTIVPSWRAATVDPDQVMRS
jgi:ABC-type lipoprotein release transport system permease subunit